MIALAVCFCSAAPTTELVVPEYLDFTAASKLAPTAFLQAVIKSGGTKGDCRTFATTTISDIETAVSSQQGVLNAIDNGDGCAAMGQTLVTSTKAAVVSAQAVVVTKQSEASAALAAKNTACSAGVDFSVGLETLEANSCYDYTSQTGYTQAKAACVAATSALATADAAVVTAQTVVTDAQATAADAVAEAARLESGCLCRVHQEQAAAQVAVQAATATNAADWKQAHEVLCAVEQTAPCPVPSCPTVEQPKLADGVDNADTQHCTAAPTAEPTMSPTAEPTTEPYGKGACAQPDAAAGQQFYTAWQYTDMKHPQESKLEEWCKTECDKWDGCYGIMDFTGSRAMRSGSTTTATTAGHGICHLQFQASDDADAAAKWAASPLKPAGSCGNGQAGCWYFHRNAYADATCAIKNLPVTTCAYRQVGNYACSDQHWKWNCPGNKCGTGAEACKAECSKHAGCKMASYLADDGRCGLTDGNGCSPYPYAQYHTFMKGTCATA